MGGTPESDLAVGVGSAEVQQPDNQKQELEASNGNYLESALEPIPEKAEVYEADVKHDLSRCFKRPPIRKQNGYHSYLVYSLTKPTNRQYECRAWLDLQSHRLLSDLDHVNKRVTARRYLDKTAPAVVIFYLPKEDGDPACSETAGQAGQCSGREYHS